MKTQQKHTFTKINRFCDHDAQYLTKNKNFKDHCMDKIMNDIDNEDYTALS